jgi:hypothetical protein
MLLRGGKPHAVTRERGRLVAQNKDDLFLDVDCEAAEHRPRNVARPCERFEDELKRERFAGLGAEDSVIGLRSSVLTGLGHRIHDSVAPLDRTAIQRLISFHWARRVFSGLEPLRSRQA